MIDGPAVVAAMEAAGFTHLVWIPDSHFGTWESALVGSELAPIRPCREGEAVGIAAGLMLGGAKPLVVIQCTGFFEAGDAVRNVVYDLKLPLKMIVGVRSMMAWFARKTTDNCPHFIEPLMRAWELPFTPFVPMSSGPDELLEMLTEFHGKPAAAVILWAE
jgi:sulfopyruvate decarboxylase TPP-binding subunit